ncbi:hypothetical protein Tcan_13356 [Toxocara canis]|uniref:Uncharacterized protein n=1 Tax=Toxocara canis TaxID=6265 RepID=A0A0B2VGG3_TOXCA|nr:hypothetical protein Tcan_13356 [Toxocara canis]
MTGGREGLMGRGIHSAVTGADASIETNASNPPVASPVASRRSVSNIRVHASLCSLLTIALIA